MKSIILAGGEGIRLKEVIKDIPKPMAPIYGKPFLELLISQLKKWGIKDIILSIGYKKEVIRTYFMDGKKWGVNIEYSEEDQPLGTGGAIKNAANWLDEDNFVVMNGDSILNIDFSKLISFHKNYAALATIGLAYVENTFRYGRIKTKETNEIFDFSEKGIQGKGFINGGVYVFNKEILKIIPEGKSSLEKDILSKIILQGIYGFKTNGFFIDIGIPEDYFYLQKNILDIDI
jgi:D-glycero-alpha-D-manno-heptose 1-phosphate guanylyltransferase